jgi:hypothetical protein
MVSQWFPSNWSHHAWGLGKLGQTVSCAHEAILTDQSPAVLVEVRIAVGRYGYARRTQLAG